MARLSAREFNRDVSAAKRAAEAEPVIITDRGTPSHVLLSYAEYVRRLEGDLSIFERLSIGADFDFEPERLDLELRDPEL